jgi:hypothetical protein
LHGIAEITFAAGAVLNIYKMKKHFDLKITDDGFSFARKTTEVAQAQRSRAAVKKPPTGVTPDRLSVHCFRTLLANLPC